MRRIDQTRARIGVLTAVLAGLCVSAGAQPKGPAQPVAAVGSVELKGAGGDVGALAIRSDGARITFSATMKAPFGNMAKAPVEFYLDTDNNAATGTSGKYGGQAGFEYKAALCLCIKYDDGSEACAGGSKAKVIERHGAMDLARYKGDSLLGGEVVDSMGIMHRKASVKVPVKGQVLESSIEYADLGGKPGQKIRILAVEPGGDWTFPMVVLTLK
jgi:hypothetical protein